MLGMKRKPLPPMASFLKAEARLGRRRLPDAGSPQLVSRGPAGDIDVQTAAWAQAYLCTYMSSSDVAASPRTSGALLQFEELGFAKQEGLLCPATCAALWKCTFQTKETFEIKSAAMAGNRLLSSEARLRTPTCSDHSHWSTRPTILGTAVPRSSEEALTRGSIPFVYYENSGTHWTNISPREH